MSGEDIVLALWTRRMTTLALGLQSGGRFADVVVAKAVLADKPASGLDAPWWDLVELVAAWVDAAERVPLPPLAGARARLLAALDAAPQPRHAWQDRADA